ncbi:MAG: 4-hydroxythreonine-4-phosphate dehydrogenase PdxA [Chloroflexota bacterium]
MTDRPLIGVTLGDPAGIGPEIVAKALSDTSAYAVGRPLAIGDRAPLEKALRDSGLKLEIHTVSKPTDGRYEHGTIDLLDVATPGIGDIEPGVIHATSGRSAYEAFNLAIELALSHDIDAIATAPLNKEALQLAGSKYLDHTTMLAAMTNSPDSLTMFSVRGLIIFFMARHMSLKRSCDEVTAANVRQVLVRADAAMRTFGRSNARIAVAALNPHGGENGMFGQEEIEGIQPGVEQARADGVNAFGPVPADAVFHQALQGKYDAVISLYHDQGHIAAKTLDFDRTVSVTTALPFIRTSVDHGTAFDIAGKGIANATAMLASIEIAAEYAHLLVRHQAASAH